MRVAVPRGVANARFDELLGLLAQEVNVGRIELVSSDTQLVQLRGKANFRSLGKRFGKATPDVAKVVTELGAELLRRLEAGETVDTTLGSEGIRIHPDDVTIERQVTSNWLVQTDGPFVVALDPQLTPDLLSEGLAREIISRVQRLRKDAGYEYTTRIALAVDGSESVVAAATTHAAFIQRETLARNLDTGRSLDPSDGHDHGGIDDHPMTITVRRWTE